MGRANRTTTRSALAAVVVMALAAFLGTTKPALAAPVSGTGEQSANAGTAVAAARLSSVAVSDEICVITSDSNSPVCESTNPVLKVYSINTGDTKGCSFTWKMYWGDGETETVTVEGADGPRFIFKAAHLYKEPQETTEYTVRWYGVSSTGGCYVGSGSNDFILDVPPR